MSHQGCHTSSLNGRGQGKGSKCPAERRFVFWPRAAPCQLPQNNRLARFIAFLSFPPPVVGEPRSGTGHGEVWWCVTRGAEQSFDRTRVQARARKKGCDCTMGRCGADAPLPPPDRKGRPSECNIMRRTYPRQPSNSLASGRYNRGFQPAAPLDGTAPACCTPRRRITDSTATSAGVTPGMRAAWPRLAGRTRLNRSRLS